MGDASAYRWAATAVVGHWAGARAAAAIDCSTWAACESTGGVLEPEERREDPDLVLAVGDGSNGRPGPISIFGSATAGTASCTCTGARGGGGGGGAPKGLSEPSGAAPAPAPMADPAAAPSPSAMFAPGPSLATDENATVTLPPHTQVIMDMVVPEEGLPEQGFTGHSSRLADHEDGETHTSDWGKEWPQVAESEGKTKERVCLQYPKTCAVPGCTSAQSF
mmetsp:Transcript_113850/g.361902  ORF Transcript_113850/g.361902 Transcript_113850/m.361902 type:complete len:221 (+) Transcript_113850:2717-3379(+)